MFFICTHFEIIYIHYQNISILTEDPFEYNNIAEENPEIVEELKAKLDKYQETMIPPHVAPETEKGNPKYFNGVYSPGWCQSEPTLDNK